jgi:hypothetical protein
LSKVQLLDTVHLYAQDNHLAYHSAYEKLRLTEKQFAASVLKINDASIDLFFTDNGQQALNVSLLCLGDQTTNIFVYNKCYYELKLDLEKNKEIKLLTSSLNAEFIYSDIRQLETLFTDLPNCLKLKTLVIDTTHNPILVDPKVGLLTQQLIDRKIRVVLVNSMLKHEGAGIDHFQGGKIFVISPTSHSLDRAKIDELESISTLALHPVVASFFQMVNEIYRDKIVPGPLTAANSSTTFRQPQTSFVANVESLNLQLK